jgi:hypothetical protein
MLFGTMTYTRLRISTGAGLNLAKACTTAVRYSAVLIALFSNIIFISL